MTSDVSKKPTFLIDGKHFKNLEEFYIEIGDKLIPNVIWGNNLDAFNDILRGGFGTPDDGFVLVWKNSKLSSEQLGYPETARQLEKRKSNCHPSNISVVEKDIEKAKKGEGTTVFDWLVEIIKSHEEIDLILE
jgi:RNAse (barnase) inhibitor barstar